MGILPIPEDMLEQYAEASSGIAGFSIPIILATAIVAPIVEEIAFRGIIFSRFQKGMPIILATILQAVLFGIMHGQILWIIFAGFMGLVMGFVAYRYDSIAPTLAIHIANNAFTFVLQILTEETEWIYNYILVPIGILVFIASMIYVCRKPKRDMKELEENAEILRQLYE